MPRAAPPPTARLLGLAGLLPGLAAVALQFAPGGGVLGEVSRWAAGLGGFVYGALILSFLGGLWWGAAAARLTDAEMAPVLIVAVVPTLWAVAALLAVAASPAWTGAMLALGLVGALAMDRRLAALRAVPDWWMALRVPLSLGLGLCMAALGWLLR